MSASQNYNVNLNINANAQSAQQQLQKLQQQLQQISSMQIDVGASATAQQLKEASQAAMELSAHLTTAMNQQTGNLDFTKFYTSIQKSKMSLQEYGAALQSIGPQGQQAFVGLASQISKAEIPLRRTSELTNKMWDGLKRTAGWQLQSSLIHGVIGGVQKAFGYARDLNKSLTDIRIVTGSSADEMARFAQKANEAAKKLSTTTTDYTRASLIYYQQGLNDAEVEARAKATIKMANATGTSAQEVSNQMTAIWNNYADGSKALTHYADVMTALGAATASSTDEIAQGLQKFASISNTVGLSYEYAASALATITAESRESADVVGNALKTLFSRIQGLQLGETLDDGTTLNKYSTALAKVGISIKDQTGGLKDMDDILNEMGSKWGTLARDEKMALAQTVAGVRQYTQLMTLMENWDDFKKNLNVANTSTGTLDKQAAIFAESWEAASDRVRASWEGLWDNLINSEGMITILDGFSHIIQFLDQMVNGLGGAGGAFLTFGGILTSVFNRQIIDGISNMAYNIKMMMPGSQNRMIAERNSFIQQARDIVAPETEMMVGKTYQAKALRAGLSTQLNQSLLYSRVSQNLTPFQQIVDAALSQQVEDAQNKFEATSIKLDAANEKRDSFIFKFADKNWNNPLFDKVIPTEPGKHAYADDFMSSGRDSQMWNSYLAEQNKILNEQLEQEQAKIKGWDKNKLSEADSIKYAAAQNNIANIKNRQAYLNKFYSSEIKDFVAPQTYSEGLARQATSLANLQKSLMGIGTITDDFKTDSEQGIKLSNALKEFSVTATHNMGGHKLIDDLTKFSTGKGEITAEQVNGYLNSGALDAFTKQSMGQLLGSVYDSLAKSNTEDLFLKAVGDRESFIAEGSKIYLDSAKGEVAVDESKKALYDAAMKRAIQLENAKERELTNSEKAVTAAQGLMQVFAAGEAVKGLTSSLLDETATFSSAITGVTSAAMQGTIGFANLSKAIQSIFKISSSTAGWIGLLVTAIAMFASTIIDVGDRMAVSNKELEQNLIASDDELNSSAETTKQTIEQYKTQNESYLSTVEKIKSLSYDPANMAEDIFQANKQALDLIKQYGLSSTEYTTNANGLIEIDKALLDSKVKQQETYAKEAEYAQILGQAINNIDKASLNYDNVIKRTTNSVDRIISNASTVYSYYGQNANNAESSLFQDKATNVKNFTYEDLLSTWTKKESGDETAQKQWNAWMQEFAQVDWKSIELAFKDQRDAGVDSDYALGIGALNSARILTNKMLSEQGISANNTTAYSAYAENIAKQAAADIKEGKYQLLDPSKNAQLTAEQQELIRGYLKEYKGVEGAGQFKVENGQVMYKGEGDTEYQHVMASTINGWYAQEQMSKKMVEYQEKANKIWENIGSESEGAAQHIKEFNTVSGANAKGILDLFETKGTFDDKWVKAFEGTTADYDSETAKVERIKAFTNEMSKEATGALEHMDLGTLENITNSISKGSYSAFNDLVNSIIKGSDIQNAEDIAKLFTALSNLDFSGNEWLNLNNIESILNDLGYTDVGYLPEILAYLQKIVGLKPPENSPKDDYDDANSNKKILNKIKPDGVYDTATKEAAEKAGLEGKNKDGGALWVQDTDGNWHFHGTQEDIDGASKRQTNAMIQADAQAKADYDAYTAATGKQEDKGQAAKQTYDSPEAFANDLYGANSSTEGDNNNIHNKSGWSGKIANTKAKGILDGLNLVYNNGQYYDENGNLLYDENDPNSKPDDLWNHMNKQNPNHGYKNVNAFTNQINRNTRKDYFHTSELQYDPEKGFYTTGPDGTEIPLTDNDLAGYASAAGYGSVAAFKQTWTNGPTAPVGTPNAGLAGYMQYLADTEKDAEGNPTIQQKNGIWQEKDADGNWVDITDFTDYQTRYNNSATNPETTTNDLSQFTAEEIIQGAKDKSPLFTDEKGITQEAIDQLSLYAEGSERLLAAQNELQAARATNNPELIDEAMKNWELAYAIESVAAARGLDADMVAQQVTALQNTGEYAEYTADSLVEVAAEMVEQQYAVEELGKNYDDLSAKINKADQNSTEWKESMIAMKKILAKVLNIKDWNKLSDGFIKAAQSSGLLARAAKNDKDAIADLMKYSALAGKAIESGLITETDLATKGFAALDAKVQELTNKTKLEPAEQAFLDFANNVNTAMDGIKPLAIGQIIPAGEVNAALNGALKAVGAFKGSLSDLANAAAQFGVTPVLTPITGEQAIEYVGLEGNQVLSGDPSGTHTITNNVDAIKQAAEAGTTLYKISYVKTGAGGGPSSPSGGGGGGGKEPKKVAQTRRSQVVKRYKNIDGKRATNKNRRDNMSKKTDKLYGESRITNLQKENKLLEEGLKLNEKKAEEALKNLKVDEESLRTMTKKYGYELELDSEGNIKNYENILGDIYDEIHKLELDGELSEEEEKIKEELEIKKEEIEGAMEDWEDTLKQLEELNNEYEELIDEMHSNELEQITYKLEFELELNELDAEWYDFLNEQIGDDFTQAVDTMDLITEKIKIANDNINLYKQSITDLMENIENDPNRSLITGYLEDGVLTDEEAEILKEAYSGIIEQLSALAEAKTSAEELLVSIFEGYKERIDFDTTALEHYTSLLEHFGNVVDIVGQKQLGLSDQFMENMAKMRIQQSRDVVSAAQSELAAYEQIRAEAEEELARAREEGRTNDIDYWQQQLNDANTSIQEARDKLVTSFEDNLNAIADAFDKAVERIVQTFSDAVYAFGGLEGLSEDYSFIRENTELMAQDYEKIYELSKLNRNINKTLNDNNIIAGKQKMIELQKEINDLQASGAELSKYDLEYLQAKYELRLAEIELENAQNAKETVRLSKDSEGNWSYVYTASTEKIDEAQQKYEDALYKMQNLSYEYIDEMSEKIISASQAMMEEIQNLNKNNFENEQEYLAEINRIKAKYAESLGVTEEELNKALANNEELYDKDWQSYSNKTGYAISESQNWIDRYAESTLGTLMKSTSDVADYMNNFSIALDELTNSIYRVAGDYYNGVDDAFAAAGITKEDFASFVTTNTKAIMDASANAKKDVETQTSTLVKEYSIQADKVTDVQRILDTAIDVYGPYIREIRDILRESAALTKELQNKDATYTYKQAADLFNSKYGEDYKIEMDAEGRWNKTVEGVKNEILQKHAEAKTDEEKKHYADMYTWLTSYILPYVTSLDTGGYTGEWGTSGRLAMLHEKELILNANDTANFLDALNVSRELVNRVIEMNARASSFGIGGLSPSSIQDFAQNLEQQVTITAEFPNAVDHNEIEEAFASLINTASQYANRK